MPPLRGYNRSMVCRASLSGSPFLQRSSNILDRSYAISRADSIARAKGAASRAGSVFVQVSAGRNNTINRKM